MFCVPATRFIQESTPIPGVELINISCVIAPSDPPLTCNASISCENSMAVNMEIMDFDVYMTTQPCNITVSVFVEVNDSPEILDQEVHINVVPLPQPTTPTTNATITTSGSIPSMLPPPGELLWSIQLIGM